MLDLLSRPTTYDTPDTAAGAPVIYTEDAAREYLATITGARPPIRTLAETWGWSKSRVDRFLRDNPGTAAGQNERTAEQLRELLTVTERPIATAAKPNADDYEWSADNPDLVAPHQDAIAVYLNRYDQVVIRAEAREYGEDDHFICVSPHNVPALIAKIKSVVEAG